MIRGPARAGGIGLLAACDVVVAAEAATFAFTEVRLGIAPAVISAVVLPRMVPNVAHRLLLTGEVFDAPLALAGGLVDLVVPAEDQGVNEFPALLEMVWDSPKPVVGVVRGPARAGGVGLLAACDVVVAAEAATFAFTEVRIGIAPAVISAVVLPRMVPSVAHRLMLTGEVFEAPQALAGGLVDLVVPAEDVDACVAAQVEALGKGAPMALAETKRLLRAARTGPLAERFPDLLDLSARLFAGEEGQEGIAAFREKRPARWVPA